MLDVYSKNIGLIKLINKKSTKGQQFENSARTKYKPFKQIVLESCYYSIVLT